jgi:hypothetical protein
MRALRHRSVFDSLYGANVVSAPKAILPSRFFVLCHTLTLFTASLFQSSNKVAGVKGRLRSDGPFRF